jgi:fucose permease
MALEFAVPVSHLLNAVPLMFAGLFLGVALAPVLASKIREGALIRAGLLLVASALFLLGISPTPAIFFVAAVLLGGGFGVLEVLGTSAAKRLRADTASKLTTLNAIFAISAFTTPIVYALIATVFFPQLTFGVLFGIALLFGCVFRGAESALPQKRVPVTSDKATAAFMIAVFFYVGAETVIAGRSSVLVSELGGVSAELAAMGGSSFWGLLALGRVLSIALTPRVLSTRVALPLWLFLAGGSLVAPWLFWEAMSSLGILVAFGLATIAAGPVYALMVGVALDAQHTQSAVSLTSALVVAGALGGFVVPGIVQGFPRIESAALIAGGAFLAALIFAAAGMVSRHYGSRLEEKV